jgi:hypothetical protein
MEDPVLPRDALGNEYVVPGVTSEGMISSPYTLRIQSVSDGTALTFEPSAMYKNVTLERGEVLEIPAATGDVRIFGSAPFAVTQYQVGGDPHADEGGPGQLAVPPRSQYRTDYKFIASPNFTNLFAIMAPTGTMVRLDGSLLELSKFTPVGASGMSVTQGVLNQPARVHVLTADKPVGVVVHGFGQYTNYMYSAGHDLKLKSPALR